MSQNQNKDKSDLYDAIFDIVRLIPYGRITSYGAIAKAIGMKSGARVVGYAMNYSHNVLPIVPAHRVVNSKGLLTGKHHFSSPDEMQRLLEEENIAVRADKVLHFNELFWDPLDLV